MNIQMNNKITYNQTAIYPDLKGKTFLVTGASSGIGRAVAIALGQQGSNVVITGRNKEQLQETADQIASQVTTHICDLTDTKQRDNLADSMPMLDGICHSAGIINPFPIRYLDEEQFDKVFNINAKAPILLTSRLLRKKKLNNNSSIVFLSSVASDIGMKGGSVYATSKAAIEAFSRSITIEHQAKAIRSNCLKLGLVKTPIFDQAKALIEAAEDNNPNGLNKLYYPLGFGNTQQVSATALFLLSAASSWITSVNLIADGGFSVSK